MRVEERTLTVKFKTALLKSSSCDCSDVSILGKETISVTNKVTAGVAKNVNKKVIFKNCAPFTAYSEIYCISEIKNTQVDNAKNIDLVMPLYDLIEYSDNY